MLGADAAGFLMMPGLVPRFSDMPTLLYVHLGITLTYIHIYIKIYIDHACFNTDTENQGLG